jgi:Family of unknown function (DUF6191)
MTEWGIDTLFNPGKRHMDEEKRRLQSTREEVGDSSGGRRIDLESGSVTISRRSAAGPVADADEADSDTDDADEAGTNSTDEVEEHNTEAAVEAGRSATQE